MSLKNRLASFIVLMAGGLLFGQAGQEPYYFVMLSDTQFGMYTGDKGFAQETANYEFAVAAVNRLKPRFVIVLGDLVNKAGDPTQIGEFNRISHRIDRTIPVYSLPGNHDVGNEPTSESLALYRKNCGRDYYSFRAGPLYGVVLDSTLIQSPKNAQRDYEEQDAWLRAELEKAKGAGAQQIVVFLHHPLFVKEPQEPDQYENIPRERRLPLLELFRKYGIRYVFSGHTHKNIEARDGPMEMVATGPVGKPLGKDGSGIRVAAVTDAGMDHHYYEFGMLPEKLVR
jgi:serine/threonine-protein phosphatase CPPED1